MGWKRVALRMALFIKEFGVEPELVKGTDYGSVAQALQGQYLRLRQEQPEQVRAARMAARQRIRRLGLEQAAVGLISVEPTQTGSHSRYKKSKAHIERWFERHPDEAVPCPHCRMKCGLRKRAWLSRELAQAARERAGSGYRVYPCPEHGGYWHVGHSKKAKKARGKEASFDPALTPDKAEGAHPKFFA